MGLLSKLFSSNNQQEPKITVTISGGIDDTPTQSKRSLSDNEAGLLDSINTTEAVVPTQKLPLSDVCPNCGVVQSKPVGRKRTVQIVKSLYMYERHKTYFLQVL